MIMDINTDRNKLPTAWTEAIGIVAYYRCKFVTNALMKSAGERDG